MATVVITFFIITIDVFKMDADVKMKRRDRISQRENRWSMNSQRLEEIVAELMKPISDLRHSFDTDLCMLLEEYLTEAGLRALDEGDSENGGSVVPNYAELALLLQQSANIYGRKVDFLYQHVLSVNYAYNSTLEKSNNESAATNTPSASRRKRKSSASADFAAIELEESSGARRSAVTRAPPVLPRAHAELAPRAPVPGDLLLADLAGEPLGLLHDFHVTWRLLRGQLVDDLEGAAAAPECALRRQPLLELQAALTASAPPDPPPGLFDLPPASPDPPSAPSPTSSPAPPLVTPPLVTLPVVTPPLADPAKKERKRKSEMKVDDVSNCTLKLSLTEEGLRRVRCDREFSVPETWVRRVVSARVAALRSERACAPSRPYVAFRGFDASDAGAAGGFAGWTECEAAAALERARAARRDPDSDDDGFFEQSSLGDSDTSRTEEAPGDAPAAYTSRPLDVRAVATRVMAALPPASPLSARALLQRTVDHPTDVSRIFLATLFLANAGSVELLAGAALTPGAWRVRACAPAPAAALCSTEEEALLR